MTAVTLRYLAGGRILDLGWLYGLGDSTVYAVIDETMDAIDAALQNITFPSTEDDAESEADV
jgi:DDE superfamily endonuclease